MKTRCSFTTAVLTALLTTAGCDPEDSGDDMMTAGSTDGGPSSQGAGDGDSGGDGGGCSMQSPQGLSCDEGADCTVSCLCSGGAVNSGSCVNGVCGNPDQTCEDACVDFDAGEYSGSYCSMAGGADSGDDDDSAGDDGSPGDDGPDGGACVDSSHACVTNGDCCGFDQGTTLCTNFEPGLTLCADACLFDSDCVSGCCVPLEGGGSVCGPSDQCG